MTALLDTELLQQRVLPQLLSTKAGMAKLADAADLKSLFIHPSISYLDAAKQVIDIIPA
jgi:hypothetical protein